MSARIILAVLLAPYVAQAQPNGAPDRAPELMQLQFNTRATRPRPDPMDGPRASAIYKRFSEPAAHGGPAPGAPAAGAASQ
jgi:hypothetical protein